MGIPFVNREISFLRTEENNPSPLAVSPANTKGEREGTEGLTFLCDTYHFLLINWEAPIGLDNDCAELHIFWMSAFVLRGQASAHGLRKQRAAGKGVVTT